MRVLCTRGVRLALLGWIVTCAACAGVRPSVRQAPAPSPEQLLQEGRRLSVTGELVAAEQYLVAAQQAGAASSRVLPLLVDVCLRAGRQRRALDHLGRALRAQPEDARLWLLSAVFSWAVGDLDEADRHLATAAALPEAPEDVAFWQARVAISLGDAAGAQRHLQAYLARAPGGRFAAWARFWMARQGGGAT